MAELEAPVLDMQVEESDEPCVFSDSSSDVENSVDYDRELTNIHVLERLTDFTKGSTKKQSEPKTSRKKVTERNFTCDVCGKKFLHQGHHKRHMKIHEPIALPVSNSPICLTNDDKTSQVAEVPLAQSPIHDSASDSFVKSVIDKLLPKDKSDYSLPFPPEFPLSAHKKTIDRNFLCKICGKGFGRNSHLKRHVKLHVSNGDSFIEDPLMVETGLFGTDVSANQGKFLDNSSKSQELETLPAPVFVNTADEVKPEVESGIEISRSKELQVETSKDSSVDATSRQRMALENSTAGTAFVLENEPFVASPQKHESVSTVAGESEKEVIVNEFPDVITVLLDEEKNRKTFVENLNLNPFVETDPQEMEGRSEEEFECSDCGKKFGRKSHLKRHMKIHIIVEYHNCQLCGKQFNQSAYLKAHMNTVHATVKPELEKIYDCPVCNKEFGRKSHLKRHLKLHVGGTTYDCNVCGKSFLQNSNLKSHMRNHAEVDASINEGLIKKCVNEETREEFYECDLCGKSFTLISSLKAHINTLHVGPKIMDRCFECTFCGKQFGRNSHLKRHVKLHVGGKVFMCDLCGRGFKQNGNLKAHIRMVHLKERTHKCSYCGKMFLQQSNLNTHIRTHTGEKPYECSICGKSFIQGNQLKYHMQSHMGLAPFSCTLCGKAFTNNRSFKKHKNAHETKKNLYCKYCPMRFCNKNDWLLHVEKAHPGETPQWPTTQFPYTEVSDDDPMEVMDEESHHETDEENNYEIDKENNHEIDEQNNPETVMIKEEVEEIIKEEPLDYASDFDSTNESDVLSSCLSIDDVSMDNGNPFVEGLSSLKENRHVISKNMNKGCVDKDNFISERDATYSVGKALESKTQNSKSISQSNHPIEDEQSANEIIENLTEDPENEDQSYCEEKTRSGIEASRGMNEEDEGSEDGAISQEKVDEDSGDESCSQEAFKSLTQAQTVEGGRSTLPGNLSHLGREAIRSKTQTYEEKQNCHTDPFQPYHESKRKNDVHVDDEEEIRSQQKVTCGVNEVDGKPTLDHLDEEPLNAFAMVIQSVNEAIKNVTQGKANSWNGGLAGLNIAPPHALNNLDFSQGEDDIRVLQSGGGVEGDDNHPSIS